MKRRILAIGALIIFSAVTDSIGAYSQPDWFINIPDSPLVIAIMGPQRHIVISNYSSVDTVSYRLGCVVKVDGRLTPIDAFAETANGILGKEKKSSPTPFGLLEIDDEILARCKNEGAKVTVIDVLFSDQTHWQFGDPFPHRPKK